MRFEEDRFKYKWQEDFADEMETLTFDEMIDELVNIAQLGDRMEHRDPWKLNYLTTYMKNLVSISSLSQRERSKYGSQG